MFVWSKQFLKTCNILVYNFVFTKILLKQKSSSLKTFPKSSFWEYIIKLFHVLWVSYI